MKDKKVGAVLKTESKVIAYVVICLVIIVLGISYALFFEVKGNEKNQIVKAGTLEFTYTNGSQITNASNSICFAPMSNEEALRHSECEYKISIRNAGTLPGNYSINLNSVNVENPIALNKLKIVLKKEGQVVAGYPKEGTTTSLVTNDKIEAGSVINYSIQVYVDKSLAEALDDEKNISLKINGDAVVNSEEINPTDKFLLTNYINELAKTDKINLIYDETKDENLRYVGGSPNNYIDIGDRDSNGNPILWRIVGIMNNVISFDNEEKQESLVKIIRANNIGKLCYDVSDSNVNNGWGVNEWGDADLMKLLNPKEVYNNEELTVNNSLYWNKQKGNCYTSLNNVYTPCDFTSSGLSKEAKNKIVKVRWNTGTDPKSDDNSITTANFFYEAERSNYDGKQLCASNKGEWCNDEVPRTTIWDGYIGLIYPSDYGFAVSTNLRNTCLKKSLYTYDTDNCSKENWLYSDIHHYYFISPTALPDIARNVLVVRVEGRIGGSDTKALQLVFPSAYLKSSTRILPNPNSNLEYGSKENPFVIQ